MRRRSGIRRRARAGVTLMELLIAVSLVSLLSLGMLLAIRVGLSAMGKSNELVETNRRVLGAERAIEQQIAGLMLVTADCRSAAGGPAARQPFFQGEPGAMRFVSSYSLQEAARGYARILDFQVIPGEQGVGVRLVVNEPLYTGPESTGALCLGGNPPRFAALAVGPASFVIADRLAFCRFSYLDAPPPPQPRVWLPQWIKPELPAAIRIEMAPLAAHPARLQVMTLTLPVRVNRTPGVLYND